VNGVADDTLPPGPLLAYYGDDFTGSTDMLDALTRAGLETVLFVSPPPPDARERFPNARCFGLAGTARCRDAAWMERELPSAFASLTALGAPILHYKVCSTFDSSPAIGSIGRAIDIGVRAMPKARWTPMLIAAPHLGRWQAFGNLFAAQSGKPFRLDRHPTMSRHPVTPMDEADLRVHLARQTPRRIELIDLLALSAGRAEERVRECQGGDTPVVLFDVLDDAMLAEAGRAIWQQRGAGLFSASSSGLGAALAAHWRRSGALAALPPSAPPRAVDRIAVVSGSCSPVSAAQIEWAAGSGRFALERLDIASVLDVSTHDGEVERVMASAVASLRRGLSPIVFSASGPDDGAVCDFDRHAAQARLTRKQAAQRVSHALAAVLPRVLDAEPLERVAVAGGDSSGAVAQALAIDTLTSAAPLLPGAPLCRADSRVAARDGLEIVLKGGQMGGPDFYGRVLGRQ
jgi:3-oxoisoapionate kinase